MAAAFSAFMFTLDRVRNVLLALAVIVLLKAAWLILAPTLPGI